MRHRYRHSSSFGTFPEGKSVLNWKACFLSLSKTNLEYLNIGRSVGAVAAAVPFYVFEPLNVRLGVAVDLTVQLDISADHRSGVCRQPGLKDWPVWRTFCSRKEEDMSDLGQTDLYRQGFKGN